MGRKIETDKVNKTRTKGYKSARDTRKGRFTVVKFETVEIAQQTVFRYLGI